MKTNLTIQFHNPPYDPEYLIIEQETLLETNDIIYQPNIETKFRVNSSGKI